MVKETVLIILAGGKSSRMGSPKGLLSFKNKPWILEQIANCKQIKNIKVYIGLGYDNELYFNNIEWLNKAINNSYSFDGVEVQVVINNHSEKGSFSTLQVVLNEIETTKEVLVLPIDVPLLNVKELQQLIAVENLIVIPKYNGKNGHPVKLAPHFWNALLTINIDSTGARLDHQIKCIEKENISYLDVFDTNIHQNMNTEEAWLRYKKSFTV